MKFIGLTILFYYISIFSIGSSVMIKCKYYMNKYWQTNVKQYECGVLNKEVFTGNRVRIEEAEGNHQSGKSNDDVKHFYIQYANMKFFPRNLENLFKNLELIFIYYSKLIEITSEDF
ncbi:hypothetical protein PVAND_009861 [Polypedilum vanderplanki]|uniref:Uncharacterized protein n=1 Tax=Polypedilum vanderplanki TaxID=319348 RepID=A0A9J6CEJ4_POLVA|nr:hypothetical protein PVAND_009861 [Polypedilum vanderplanki]